MQYLKHRYIGTPRRHPEIEGLEVHFWLKDAEGDYCLSTAPDGSAISNATVLTVEEWMNEITPIFENYRNRRTMEAYTMAKSRRSAIMDTWYHPTEIINGAATKVAEANAAIGLTDEQEMAAVAPGLAMEAMIRGTTIKYLAEAVIQHFEQMRQMDNALAGYRGKLADQLAAIGINPDNPTNSILELKAVDLNSGWPV